MDDWQRIMQGCLRKPEEIAQKFGLDIDEVRRIARVFKIQITPYYASLIKHRGDPMWRQMVPDPAELAAHTGDADPLNEDGDSPSPASSIVIPTACSSSCRTAAPPTAGSAREKRKVGDPSKIHSRYIEDGLDYIRAPPQGPVRRDFGGYSLMLGYWRL